MDCMMTMKDIKEPEAMFTIEGVATGGLIAHGLECYPEAMKAVMDASMAGEEELEGVDEEQAAALVEAMLDVNPVEDFDGYILINGTNWPVKADWKKSFNTAFCVSAEGAHPNCYAQRYGYANGSYSLRGANKSAIFAARPEKIDNAFLDSDAWTNKVTGLSEGVGLWSVEAQTTFDVAAGFDSMATFAQVKESVSKPEYFRFSPSTVTVHAWNGNHEEKWFTAEYELTGAASLAAGFTAAVAAMLF